MNPGKLTLQRLFHDNVRYVVPLYQRPYVWERKSHWEPLWQDVTTVLERHVSGEATRGHFLGAIVVEQEQTRIGEIDRRLVIDGQQRITTLQLLLAAVAAQAEDDDAGKVARLLGKLVRNDPDRAAGVERFKIMPTNADRDEFFAVMTGDDALATARDGDHAGGIRGAYRFFRQAVADWVRQGDGRPDSVAERYEILWAVLTQLLEVVSIDLEPGDDAQVIFETLNARGTPLLAMDLVKNAVFHRAEAEAPEAVDRLHHDVWEPELGRSYWREEQRQGRLNRPRAELFLMHWLTMRLRDTVAATELFATFRGRVLASASAPPTRELIAELCRDAAIMRSFDDLPVTSPEGRFFHRLAVLDTTTVLPVALLLFRSAELPPDRRAKAFAALESWLVRRMICGLTTKNYNRVVIDLLDAVAAQPERADEAIIELLDRWDAPTNRWPRDNEVRQVLETRSTYGWIAQRRLVMVLSAIEHRRRQRAKTESIIDPETRLSIEHIMPQEWRTNWPLDNDDANDGDAALERDGLIHHLGNLTLVTGALNASLSNGPWESKRQALVDHSLLLLNAEVAKADVWDEDAIRARCQRLAEEVCEIWMPPPTERPLAEVLSSAKAPRTTMSWTIRDLLEAGKLAVGERLVARDGVSATAIVGEDGTLEVEGEIFRTPSAAAKRVTGKVAEHGWRFWRVARGEQRIPIDALREELGAENDD